MLSGRFGVEIEFTGITREEAAKAAAEYLHGACSEGGTYYDAKLVTAPDGRVWKFVSDGSIHTERRQGRKTVAVRDGHYSVELVTPILTYREDIETLQGLVRTLRKKGAFPNRSCGIHIHLDGANHMPRSLRNFVNIIASKNDLFYKALAIEPERIRFCKKMDAYLVEQLNRRRPDTFRAIEDIWYAGYTGSRGTHYHNSRYHFLYGQQVIMLSLAV